MPANIAKKKKKVIAYDDNFERKMSPSAITKGKWTENDNDNIVLVVHCQVGSFI